MRCYRLPGFQSRLLLELQRQQHNTLFCDTLLQTEGVSVPAHGCVLAALSPYLSCKLSASPHPPAGHQRQVKLQAVNAQTLLKLVGLLYSGLLEVNELTDRDDVLAAANRLGFDRLVEGQEVVRGAGGAGAGQAIGWEASQLAEERKDREKRVTCDAEVQVETWCRRDAETQIGGTGSVDAASQTAGFQSGVRHSWSSRDDASLRGELGPGSPTALLDEAGLSKGVTKTATTTKSLRSTRVKLRKVQQGAGWEVVNMRDMGQRRNLRRSQAIFPALKKNRAKLLRTQAEGTKEPSAASTSQPSPVTKQHKSSCMSLGLTVQPPRTAAFTDLQSPASPCCTTESNDSMATLLSQAQCSVEDQEIQKLLDDIMMGLNILPSSGLEEDGNRSSFKSNGAAIPSAPPALEWTARQGEVDTAASVVGSQGYKRLWEDALSKDASSKDASPKDALPKDASPKDASPKDTVLHSRSSFCLVPVAASTPSVHCAETWPQTERQSNQIAQAQSSLAQEQPASKDSSPNESFTQCHSLNHSGQGDTTDQSALCSEPLDYQDLHTLNVASIAPDTVNSDSQQTDQPASKALTWMSSTLHALQFPLNSVSKEETKPSEPEDPARLESLEDLELWQSLRQSTEVMQEKRKPPVKKLCVKAAKEKMQSSDRDGLTGAISPFGKASKRKDPPLKLCDTKDKPVTSKGKRKCEAHTDDASDRTLGYKVTRHGAGEFSKIFLNVCSVSLSRNNVLSKRRILKQEPPVFKEPQKVLDTTAVDKGSEKLKADKTITETRKRSTPRARSASTTKDKADEIVETVPVIKRKVGRPWKIKTVPHDANPSIDKILESYRKMNALAEIGEQRGQNKGKPRRKGRKVVRNVPISNDEVHDDVPSSDTVSATEPPRVTDEQLCTQPHDPSESEPNEHRAGSENTRTEEGKMTGNPESRVNPAVKPKEAKRTSTASLKQFKQPIKFRHITIRGSKTKTKVISSEVEDNVHSDVHCSKDIGFHSNKGEETREVEIEEMGEALLDGEERLVERPDEASDSANSTETLQAPVGDSSPYWVCPSQQSNVTTTYCPLPSEPQNRSPDIEGSRHSQEDEMEVDILLCSPDKGRGPMEFGGRVIVDTSQDEDEEELEEIDVMGI